MPKKFLSTGCMFSCTFSPTPMIGKASRKHITMNGMQVMTTKDTDVVKTFGICQLPGLPPKPCSPKLTKWLNFEPTMRFKGAAPLTTKSFIMCAFGGKVSPKNSGQIVARVEGEKITCPLCGKDQLKHPFDLVALGTNTGSSTLLGRNILNNKAKESHKFYLKDDLKGGGIEAHHLICTEAMQTDDWSDICIIFGYDINKKENGVYLPNIMSYACHLHLPLHKSEHEAGFGIGDTRYPKSVQKAIDPIIEKYKYKPCDKLKMEQLNNDLDSKSKEIFGNVDRFSWWITHDGFHYQRGNPIGCSNGSIFDDKHKQKNKAKKTHNSNANLKKITVRKMEEIRQIRTVAYNLMEPCHCGRCHKEYRGKSTKNTLIISE